MAQYQEEFVRRMQEKGIKYSEVKPNVLSLVYGGENLGTISIYVTFDADGKNDVRLASWEIANFKEDRRAEGIACCQEQNEAYRWVKFYLDDDGDVRAEIDALLYPGTAADTCMALVNRMVAIIDDVYPAFMKARFA